jgi:hypothetical protein
LPVQNRRFPAAFLGFLPGSRGGPVSSWYRSVHLLHLICARDDTHEWKMASCISTLRGCGKVSPRQISAGTAPANDPCEGLKVVLQEHQER